MKKLFLIILTPFLLTSCIGDSSKTMGDRGSQNTQSSAHYAETLSVASPKIKETPEFDECLNPSVNMCIAQVGSRLAQEKSDISYCNEITNDESKESCRFGIIIAKAIQTKDIQSCAELTPSYKKSCEQSVVSLIAREKGDVTICNQLAPDNGTGGEMNPSGMGSQEKDQCIQGVIMTQGEKSEKDCDLISNTVSQKMCKETIKMEKK